MNEIGFGTDGIRKPAEQLNPIAPHIGMAVGLKFRDTTGCTVMVGGDTRESTPYLMERIGSGLERAGATVIDVGVIPTPGLAYLAREYGEHGANAAVMVSASHNPPPDNGIKAFGPGGNKLTDNEQESLEKYIKDDYLTHLNGGGWHDRSSLRQKYLDFLVGSAEGDRFDGLKIAIDCANGAASEFAPEVFKRLGATVTALFAEPNGRNINQNCGATDTAALQETVVAGRHDLGIALDGDADRVMLVDGKGNELNGDHLLYILAVTGGLKQVVATQMSNLGLEKTLAEHGISLHRTDVGDRQVLAGIEQTGAQLGGEQSGHIILPEHLATGDGMLAAIQVIRAVRKSGKTLEEWRAELDLLPQTTVNIPLTDKTRLAEPAALELIAREADLLEGKGRVNIRASGTEPKARVMVEASDADARAADIAERLRGLVEGLGNLRLMFGRNYDLEDQLITNSRQEHISGKNGRTRKDLTERFGDRKMLEKWMAKGRNVIWLVDPSSDPDKPALAGIFWSGEKAFPLQTTTTGGELPLTLATRLYKGYTGKHLSAPFMRHSLLALGGQYRARGEKLPGIWLQTDDDNIPAQHTYAHFGFETVHKKDGRLTMISPAAALAVI